MASNIHQIHLSHYSLQDNPSSQTQICPLSPDPTPWDGKEEGEDKGGSLATGSDSSPDILAEPPRPPFGSALPAPLHGAPLINGNCGVYHFTAKTQCAHLREEQSRAPSHALHTSWACRKPVT